MNGGASERRLTGLRILQLTQRYPPAVGGVERHVERLVCELERAGANVAVATTDLVRDRPFGRQPAGSEAGSTSIRRHRAARWLPAPHGLGIAAPGMLVDALGAPADVMHAHALGYFPTWAARLARAFRPTPLVVTPHSHEGSGSPLSRLYGRATTWATVRRADRVVALSRREAGQLAESGVDRDRLRVIPNGVDLDEFSGVRRRSEAGSLPVVLYVGRVYPEQKGLQRLFEAFASLGRDASVQLRMVGEDWGGTEGLLRFATERGVRSRVHATGRVSRGQLLAEYAAARLLVVPSNFDAFPIVLLEGMAAGLPIVATAVGAIPEVVIDGRTGLLVPPGRPEELADALGRLLSDRELADRLGTAGRDRASQFSWERIGPQYRALYAELVDRH